MSSKKKYVLLIVILLIIVLIIFSIFITKNEEKLAIGNGTNEETKEKDYLKDTEDNIKVSKVEKQEEDKRENVNKHDDSTINPKAKSSANQKSNSTGSSSSSNNNFSNKKPTNSANPTNSNTANSNTANSNSSNSSNNSNTGKNQTPAIDPNAVDTSNPLYGTHHGTINASTLNNCDVLGEEKQIASNYQITSWSCLGVYANSGKILGYYLELHYD